MCQSLVYSLPACSIRYRMTCKLNVCASTSSAAVSIKIVAKADIAVIAGYIQSECCRKEIESAANMVAVMHVYVQAVLSTCCINAHWTFKSGKLLFQAISSGLLTAVTIFASYPFLNVTAVGNSAIIIDKSVD